MVKSFTELRYAVDGGVAHVTLNRPHQLNSFSTTLYRELRDAVRVAEADATVDTIVITGEGRAFATGGDLKEVLRYIDPAADPLDIYRFEDNLPFDTIQQCPKVTIAAINGICMAGGLITALSCDISVAVADAVFAAPEARVGVAEGLMPARMFGSVSVSKMRYLLLTGKSISAAEAERIGIVTEVVADHSALTRRVDEIVEELSATSPTVRRRYKEYINGFLPKGTIGAFREFAHTEESVEGLSAFAEKRPPRYQNG